MDEIALLQVIRTILESAVGDAGEFVRGMPACLQSGIVPSTTFEELGAVFTNHFGATDFEDVEVHPRIARWLETLDGDSRECVMYLQSVPTVNGHSGATGAQLKGVGKLLQRAATLVGCDIQVPTRDTFRHWPPEFLSVFYFHRAIAVNPNALRYNPEVLCELIVWSSDAARRVVTLSKEMRPLVWGFQLVVMSLAMKNLRAVDGGVDFDPAFISRFLDRRLAGMREDLLPPQTKRKLKILEEFAEQRGLQSRRERLIDEIVEFLQANLNSATLEELKALAWKLGIRSVNGKKLNTVREKKRLLEGGIQPRLEDLRVEITPHQPEP
jgi:hypothetical protein